MPHTDADTPTDTPTDTPAQTSDTHVDTQNDGVVLLDVADRIATITINRPEARNALSSRVLRELPAAMSTADARDDVDVIILTGADPAFCAGLDLKELGSSASQLSSDTSSPDGDGAALPRRPFPAVSVPLIGAINGVAVTGGFELALNCDFLVASERAKFGDTHARVGVMPGWGLTVLLPQAIGVRRAREMSFTGNFMDAEEALQWGLVNHVVPHEQLMATARQLAADIVGNQSDGVRQIRSTYAAIHADEDGWRHEAAEGAAWIATRFTPDAVAERRAAIQARGREQ